MYSDGSCHFDGKENPGIQIVQRHQGVVIFFPTTHGKSEFLQRKTIDSLSYIRPTQSAHKQATRLRIQYCPISGAYDQARISVLTDTDYRHLTQSLPSSAR